MPSLVRLTLTKSELTYRLLIIWYCLAMALLIVTRNRHILIILIQGRRLLEAHIKVKYIKLFCCPRANVAHRAITERTEKKRER